MEKVDICKKSNAIGEPIVQLVKDGEASNLHDSNISSLSKVQHDETIYPRKLKGCSAQFLCHTDDTLFLKTSKGMPPKKECLLPSSSNKGRNISNSTFKASDTGGTQNADILEETIMCGEFEAEYSVGT
eukprot:5296984-Ditylum_brightwellii.AAC.1